MAEELKQLSPDEFAEKIAGLQVSAHKTGNYRSLFNAHITSTLAEPDENLIEQLYPHREELFGGLSPRRLELFVHHLYGSVFANTVEGKEMIAYVEGRVHMARELGQVRQGLNQSLEEIDRLTT